MINSNTVNTENANIGEFLRGMEDYIPPIPDSVIMHILADAGMSTSDARVHRTINVACQKFISDVLDYCMHKKGTEKATLKVSDLKQALEHYGIRVDRPEFIVSFPPQENSQ